MHIVIFGRPGCPFCVRAKDLAEKLETSQGATYRYVDIQEEGITKADMEKTIGKPVTTVPQIFIDKQHIGGYTEMEAHARQEGWV
ncbi:glutaredoxin 1 [Marinospirillum celere]|uniref:Glutaredoxin 1 n=1 Tax=Marinospirillum celere TaxID=1122252 RepID=A0A1I1ERK0_9GAMM|nr:GrxA family glutaredoxin [Marinospirillum celere]SFB89617.1 glutaredoxin 1 [Marinospirillum celere]